VTVDAPITRVLSRLEKVRRVGDGYSARCPSHKDDSPSLSVGIGEDDRVLLRCHAGCELEDIVAALGLEVADLFPAKEHTRATPRRAVESYDYTDENGTLLYQVVRYDPKDFRQRRPDGSGGWIWNLRGTRRVLYRLPKLLSAVARSAAIYVVEGEKDVAALEAAGEVATCSPGGAEKWRDEYSDPLSGARVIVVADRDETGRKHAREVAESLARTASSVQVVEPLEGKDAHDHLVVHGHTVDEFVAVGDSEGAETNDAVSQAPADEDGAQLLDELREALTRYVVLPGPEAADAVVLWIAATHGQPVWNHAPRLAAVSPIKQCGKSRLMDVVHATCHRPLITVNASIAAVVRSIGDDDPITLLVDEADTIFGTKRAAENNEDLRGVLNAGHQRNRAYLRWDMSARRIEQTPTFAMAMLAAIRDLPDTIMDRAVTVRMRRRGPGESISAWRERTAPATLQDLRDRLHRYVRLHLDELAMAEPAMPVEDRAADTWEPMVAVADLAGGDWPQRARRACIAMSRADADDGGASERLLADVAEAFGHEDKLKTSILLERLWSIDEAPWSDWRGKGLTARGLRTLLKPYGITSKNIRFAGDEQAKGYERADFADAWARYLRTPAVPSVPASQTGEVADQSRDGCGTEADPRIRPSADQELRSFRDGGTDGTPSACKDKTGTRDPGDQPTCHGVGHLVPTSTGAGASSPQSDEDRTREQDELDAAVQLVLGSFPGSQVVNDHDTSGPNGSGNRGQAKPLGGEIFAIAAELDHPRTDLDDGTTILAGEASWRTFCAVALPPDRRRAFDGLRRLEKVTTA
jgi:hypothetical protein